MQIFQPQGQKVKVAGDKELEKKRTKENLKLDRRGLGIVISPPERGQTFCCSPIYSAAAANNVLFA